MSAHWDDIRVVTTPDELEKVYRFRYRIYVEEMHRPQADADHERKRIEDKLDAAGFNVAAFKGDEVVGVVRVNFPRAGNVSFYSDLYQMGDAGADHPDRTSIVTRLMIEPKLRNGTLGVRLASACYALGLDNGIRWCFIDCREHHIRFFEGLGFKVHLERIEHPEYGPATLMLLDCWDISNLESCGSPFRKDFHDPNRKCSIHSGATAMTIIDPIAEAKAAFNSAIHDFLQTTAMQTVQTRVTKEHYKSALREIYHYTKENPQMQACASVYFRGDDRTAVKQFLRHALSEVGHEQLALDDLRTLGEETSHIPSTQPLPSTVAFTAFGFYQIMMRNPVGYLGYLYFLEYLPTQHGSVFGVALAAAGVPKEAMTFLADHMAVDMGHNQLMDKYLMQCVHDRADMDAVIYGLRVCAYLYSQMLQGAFDRVDNPRDFGVSREEERRLRDHSLDYNLKEYRMVETEETISA